MRHVDRQTGKQIDRHVSIPEEEEEKGIKEARAKRKKMKIIWAESPFSFILKLKTQPTTKH